MTIEGDTLQHVGMPRRSGRYPWGSGKDPHRRNRDVLDDINDLKDKGYKETEIYKMLGYSSSTQLRAAKTIAVNERKKVFMEGLESRQKRGMNYSEIARDMGVPEPTVRYTLKNSETIKQKQLKNTSEMLKETLKETPYLDVGPGVELQLGVSRQKLNVAVAQLEQEGYTVHNLYAPRLNDPSKGTTVKVLTKEKDYDVVKKHKDEVAPPNKKSTDGGQTYEKLHKPESVSWSEVGIRYGDKGGVDRDGLIQVRPGVEGLDLGSAKYAQVRIAVNGTHYLKGMAVYSDDLPKGKNLVFNTNKESGTPKEKVLKALKDNSVNPFGARIIAQRGKFNIVNEEGTWDSWNGSKFSAQFLSKQPLSLIKDRIGETAKSRKKELDELLALNNPVVRKKLLEDYADGISSQEKELKVMGLPRTRAKVLMPYPEMKPNEVYAPDYKNGERVVLIRYPHAGTFEIPELTVNNKSSVPKKQLGNALDAIGIHPSVAHKLSGADFDGDAVYVIPNNKKQIKSSPSLKGLKDFDPNSYTIDRSKPGAPKKIDPVTKQHKMGEVSNLIADMTIKGASVSELTRAVRHSMVIIDSEKHDLDWRKSAADNNISALRNKYQMRESVHFDPETGTVKKGRKSVGGATLVTRADSTVVSGFEKYRDGSLKTKTAYKKEKVKVPLTDSDGNQLYTKAGKPRTKTISQPVVGKDGKKVLVKVPVQVETPVLDLVKDASILSSGTAKENEYASYINQLKVMSNKASKAAQSISLPDRDPKARVKYAKDVASLNNKLKAIEANAPYERQAQLLANNIVSKNINKDMTSDQKNKMRQQAMEEARGKVGALKKKDLEITFSDSEWEAVQNNAVSHTMLEKLLNNANKTHIKELATPKQSVALPSAKLSKAKTLLSKGYTWDQVAESLGVSTSTLHASIKAKGV